MNKLMAKKAEAVHISYHTIVKNMHVNKNAKYLSHTNSILLKSPCFSVTFTYMGREML